MYIKCEMYLISFEDCCKCKYLNIKVVVKIDVKNLIIIKDYNVLFCNIIIYNLILFVIGVLG